MPTRSPAHAVTWPVALAAALLSGAAGLAGCYHEQPAPGGPPPTPAPTFTGRPIFHGTIASIAALRGWEEQLVGGYGFVWGLNGTGSSEVPAFLRQYMTNLMRKEGVGSPRRGLEGITPDRLMADPNTTVVVIQGLIPPGATKGTPFDLLVSALDTQTTSLQGGRMLFGVDLSLGGASPALRFSRPLARADGQLYLSPFHREAPRERQFELQRQAVILGGGRATVDRVIELVLFQPAPARARLVADRINERYRHERATEIFNTAVARNPQIIHIHIPRRFAGDPHRFLSVVSKIYLQRAPNFEADQARKLAEALVAEPAPALAQDVADAWEALGKLTWPVIREYYHHPDVVVRFAALQAGARMEDELAVEPLAKLAADPDPGLRRRAAQALGNLPQSLQASSALLKLLDDPEAPVRIDAYEALAGIGDPAAITRTAIGGPGQLKFVLDLVQTPRPLLYVRQAELPRLVVFSPNLSFKTPLMARIWDNHLMLRWRGPDEPLMTVFYQPPGDSNGQTYQIAPTLANLVFLMGNVPEGRDPKPGLDLSYSQVVDAVYELRRQGWVDAGLTLQASPLAEAIARAGAAAGPQPETAPADAAGAPQPPPKQPEPPALPTPAAPAPQPEPGARPALPY